jgi:polysaccharide export outer membrane protein
LRTGDLLAIRFPLNPELNDEVTVGPDGLISTADAENVLAAGRPASDVAADLRLAYKALLRAPRLSVAVKSFAQVPVFVGGEVVAPGEFRNDIIPLTLSEAIARAGGLRTSGSAGRVFVIRRGPGDHPLVYSTRYDQVMRGDAKSDVRLAPWDLVYVPRTTIAEAYVYFNQYVQQFVPINWGFSYQINPYPNQTQNR